MSSPNSDLLMVERLTRCSHFTASNFMVAISCKGRRVWFIRVARDHLGINREGSLAACYQCNILQLAASND